MLDTTELVHSIASPPALSLDTPIVSDNLPVTDPPDWIITPEYFQAPEDLMDEGEDLDDLLPPWEDDTVD